MRRKNYFSDGILGNQCALLRKKVNPTESMVRMHPSLPSDRGLTLTPPAAHIMYICISTMDLPAVWLTFLPSHSLHTSSVVHRGGCWGLPQLCPNPETTRCSVACEMGVVGVRRTYVATRLTTTGDVAGWHEQERDGMPPPVATRGSPEFPALSTNMGGLFILKNVWPPLCCFTLTRARM